MVKRDPFAFIEAADHPAALFTRDSDDFVDHDLRWRLEAIGIVRLIVSRYSGASTSSLVRSATSTLSVADSQSDWTTTAGRGLP
jgi:hypothetical protein